MVSGVTTMMVTQAAAVEARFQKLREKYPDVHILTKWF